MVSRRITVEITRKGRLLIFCINRAFSSLSSTRVIEFVLQNTTSWFQKMQLQNEKFNRMPYRRANAISKCSGAHCFINTGDFQDIQMPEIKRLEPDWCQFSVSDFPTTFSRSLLSSCLIQWHNVKFKTCFEIWLAATASRLGWCMVQSRDLGPTFGPVLANMSMNLGGWFSPERLSSFKSWCPLTTKQSF